MLVQHTTNDTDEDYAIPLSTTYDAVQYVTCSDSPAHYQPLDTVTTDYTSVYTTLKLGGLGEDHLQWRWRARYTL